MAFFGLYKTKAERELERQERGQRVRESLLSTQNTVGERLYTRLQESASQNAISNVLSDGTKVEGVDPIFVERMRDNGGQYSVIISVPDRKSITYGGSKPGHPVVQVDVDMARDGEELHVIAGRYGPEKRFPARLADHVGWSLAEYVREYTLFPRPETPQKPSLFQ